MPYKQIDVKSPGVLMDIQAAINEIKFHSINLPRYESYIESKGFTLRLVIDYIKEEYLDLEGLKGKGSEISYVIDEAIGDCFNGILSLDPESEHYTTRDVAERLCSKEFRDEMKFHFGHDTSLNDRLDMKLSWMNEEDLTEEINEVITNDLKGFLLEAFSEPEQPCALMASVSEISCAFFLLSCCEIEIEDYSQSLQRYILACADTQEL